jgi:hypothetical protein
VSVHLLDAARIWECPACRLRDKTVEAQPHTRFHPCRALGGLTAPMIDVTHRDLDPHAQRVRIIDREDYVAGEIVTTTREGRPAMAVDLERSDGSNDRLVFPGCASVSGSTNQ